MGSIGMYCQSVYKFVEGEVTTMLLESYGRLNVRLGVPLDRVVERNRFVLEFRPAEVPL
jgi:hypothetical protein